MKFPEGTEIVSPGDRLKLSFKLEKPLPLEKGMKYIIREASKTIAVGEIIDIPKDTLEDMPIGKPPKDDRKKRKR